MTILYGLKDPALDPRICLDGIEAFFSAQNTGGGKSNHIIRLPQSGHWAFLDTEGRRTLEGVLEWFLLDGSEGETSLQDRIEAMNKKKKDGGRKGGGGVEITSF